MACCKDFTSSITNGVLKEFVNNSIVSTTNKIKSLLYEKQDIQRRVERIDLETEEYTKYLLDLIKKLENINNE